MKGLRDQLRECEKQSNQAKKKKRGKFSTREIEDLMRMHRPCYERRREAAEEFGLDEIETHTLRKTYGYHIYMQTKNIAQFYSWRYSIIRQRRLRYIGVNQDVMEKAMTRFKI